MQLLFDTKSVQPERSQQNAERNKREHPPLIRLRSHGTMHSSYPVSSYVLPGLGEEPQAVATVMKEERIPRPQATF
jgi:hypothetical protein